MAALLTLLLLCLLLSLLRGRRRDDSPLRVRLPGYHPLPLEAAHQLYTAKLLTQYPTRTLLSGCRSLVITPS